MKKIKDNLLLNKLILLFYDILTMAGSSVFALWLIKEPNEIKYFENLALYGPVLILVNALAYQSLRLYSSLWKYASISEATRLLASNLITFFINCAICASTEWMPIRWAIIYLMITFAFGFIGRFSYRFLKYYKNGSFMFRPIDLTKTRVMIIGGGDAGTTLIREMLNNTELNMSPCCIIDDDIKKQKHNINGVPVVGTSDDILEKSVIFKINLIIIAMPSVSNQIRSEIIKKCQQTKCKVQTIPGLYQFVNGQISMKSIRNVEVEDLLGREPIKVNLEEIMSYVSNKTILVTGGGGSIGSELCRQIAQNNPKLLIIFDIYENNAYEIEQELKLKYHNKLNLLVLIGSVRDTGKLEDVFMKYHPDIVYHAAAHKHVPLMETSPNEAIKNNVFGTLNTSRMADKYNVQKFILISTDKAVNPTNIMGASKRICEMIIQTLDKHSKTEFGAVRFGNVLGSNGSVIPLFKKQMENGGPVTVTHKDITRFFMTISEAVSLVLQAGVYAKGGEIFILDMGKPVRIYDLAENLIRLSGYIPNETMKIEITGLRPGEKLYEELLMSEEGLQATENNLIHIGKPIVLDETNLFNKLDELYKAAYAETPRMKQLIAELVDTYKIDKEA